MVDEAHGIGASTRKEFYDWLWDEHNERIQGRIGLTATPYHYDRGEVVKFFGSRGWFAGIESHELDSQTGLPRIGFWEENIRLAHRGFLALPLYYAMSEEAIHESKDHRYEEADLNSLIATLEKVAPAKVIVFHPPGANTDLGSAARMKQFAQALLDNDPQKRFGMVTWVSGETPKEERDTIFSKFKESTHGVLNLTQLGGQGIDIPSANLAVLTYPMHSQTAIIQRVGRVLRLSPGKAFARILDWTGENVEFQTINLAELGLKVDETQRRVQASAIRDKLNELGLETPIPESMIKDIYEVWGQDARYMGQMIKFLDV